MDKLAKWEFLKGLLSGPKTIWTATGAPLAKATGKARGLDYFKLFADRRDARLARRMAAKLKGRGSKEYQAAETAFKNADVKIQKLKSVGLITPEHEKLVERTMKNLTKLERQTGAARGEIGRTASSSMIGLGALTIGSHIRKNKDGTTTRVRSYKRKKSKKKLVASALIGASAAKP